MDGGMLYKDFSSLKQTHTWWDLNLWPQGQGPSALATEPPVTLHLYTKSDLLSTSLLKRLGSQNYAQLCITVPELGSNILDIVICL